MRAGEKVQRKRDGAIGKILQVDADHLVVEVVPGDVRTWHRASVRPWGRAFEPRGIPAPPSEQMLEATRMKADGATYDRIACHFGISVHTVGTWLERVRAAVEEARNKAALERSGT